MSQTARKDIQRPEKNNEPASPTEPIITPVIPPGNRFTTTSRNVGSATFSSMAKQAESLVNGDNSIMFNSYNNNAVFKSARMDVSDCVAVDVLNKSINNVSVIAFENNTILQGISDGYTINNQGAMVPLYDSNIALSTAFGYEYAQTTDTLRKDLNIEIERRKYDHSVLLSSFQQTSAACEHAVRMIHYIDYDTENHAVNVVIPYENPQSQTLTHLDDMPSETISYSGIDSNPSTGIVEEEPVPSEQKTIVTIERDGTIIDGSAIVSSDLAVPVINTENIYTETLTLPPFMIDVPGATYKHPYRGQIIEIPTTKPTTEEDESYYFYAIFGGVSGDTVINPNYGLSEKYTVPTDALFDCENREITREQITEFGGKIYIGINHESVLAGMVVQLPLTVGETISDEARLLMDLIEYDPGNTEVTTYTNPNYRMVGYCPMDDILFDTTSDVITLKPQFKYIFIDSDTHLDGIYFTPTHTVVGIADTIELPSDNIVPTVRAVMEHVSEELTEYDGIIMTIIRTLIQQLSETISFDLDVKQYSLEYNAALTDYLINSTGGLGTEPTFIMPVNPRPGEIPDFAAPATPTNWSLWINIRKWIMQGIADSLLQRNGRTYWKDCSNYDILYERLGFAAALGQISTYDSSWGGELGKGDILRWTIGSTSLTSGNTARITVHSEAFKDEDDVGGYLCSGAAGFHTNTWLYVGNSTDIPKCNRVDGTNYNVVCTGSSTFSGHTDIRGPLRFVSNSALEFQNATILYGWDNDERVFTKSTTFDGLMNRITSLESENASLKARVSTLEADVAYLKQLVKHFTL